MTPTFTEVRTVAGKVYFRGSRDDAARLVRGVFESLIGRDSSHADLAEGVHRTIGFAALSDIREDYLRKSSGAVGEDGVRWPKLAPATLAYGRKAPRGRGHAPGGKDGLLTKSQLKRWRNIYGTRLARLAASMPLGAAKARAAQIAWATVKREGGKTKIAEYANRPHEILRDTGVLLNSLSPGEVGNPDQIFRTITGGVIVGTNVPYARSHQEGRRPFLPKNDAPDIWKQRWLEEATDATATAVELAVQRESP